MRVRWFRIVERIFHNTGEDYKLEITFVGTREELQQKAKELFA